jgi:hypothetical protein
MNALTLQQDGEGWRLCNAAADAALAKIVDDATAALKASLERR